MKKILLAAAAVVALAGGSASAADLARPVYRAPSAPIAIYTWTGPYWGVNVGYSWGRKENDWTLSGPGFGGAVLVATEGQDVDGVVGGITSGINWQIGRWVWGLEHDFNASGQKGDTTYCIVACGVATVVADHKLKWFGTARSRLGFLWSDYVLVYATAGVAYGKLESTYTLTAGAVALAALNSEDVRAGFTFGGGVEWAWGGGWSAKAEYLYVDLGKREQTLAVVGGNVFTWENRFYDHIARVGINFKWGR